MAGRKGQRSGGHNAKTTEQHKIDGTFQKCRHGGRADNEAAIGTPKKPPGLEKIQNQVWDEITSHLPDGCLGGGDTTALREMCEFYLVYHKAIGLWKADPLDKDARLAATAAWDRFWRIAQEFGASPVARTRLELSPPSSDGEDDQPTNPIAAILQFRDGG